jgi:hypothetical protein
MSWRDLLDEGRIRTLPWVGFTTIHDAVRSWSVRMPYPPEHGWYKFEAGGDRWAFRVSDELVDPDPSYFTGLNLYRGYVVGDRFIQDGSRVDPDPEKLIEQTIMVYCVEPGLERFARASVVMDRAGHFIYKNQEFPLGPENDVLRAYQDRKPDLSNLQGITPSIDLAFRWVSHQRDLMEKRRAELARIRAEEEAKRAEEERVQQLMKDAGSAVGRRALATRDFETAAKEALKVSGAELLDARPSHNRNEMVVQYRFRERRLECVVDKQTFRVIDSGICLTDHHTGVKGDTFFTLESLPGVVGEAMNLNKLVVYRHVDGDEDYDDDD